MPVGAAKATMKVKIDVFAAIILGIVHCAYSEHILRCNVTALEVCPGDHQICVQRTLECVCIDGYVRVDDDCTQETPGHSSHHDTTAAVVSIFTIALIICGLVLVLRKYNLIDYIQEKLSSRTHDDILYEDVMIGQDDPPLTP